MAARLPRKLTVRGRIADEVLEGWRDPFVFQRNDSSGKTAFQMVVGSGTRDAAGGKRGCVMRYTAPALEGPWQYRGIIAGEAKGSPPKLGRVWECPALLQIAAHSSRSATATATAPGGPNGHDASPRDFVPTTGDLAPGSDGAAALLVFGAYTSTEQQAQPRPWAWDPVMYYLGDFDGEAMEFAGLQARQCALNTCAKCHQKCNGMFCKLVTAPIWPTWQHEPAAIASTWFCSPLPFKAAYLQAGRWRRSLRRNVPH